MSGRGTSNNARRGKPVAVLALLLMGWGVMRMATWASPVPDDYRITRLAGVFAPTEEMAGDAAGTATVDPPALRASVGPPADRVAPAAPAAAPAPLAPSWSDPALSQMPQDDGAQDNPLAGAQVSQVSLPAAPRMAAGHALLMMAGLSQMEVPPQIAAFYRAAEQREGQGDKNPLLAAAGLPQEAALPVPAGQDRPAQSRWSADGWLLWRDDTTTPITSGRPSYGRSQLGAVVRYQLAPSSGMQPQAYLRGSAALQGASEQEMAAGLSARPLARVPIRLAAEVRVSDRAAGTEVRPAAFAVTELAPQQLPGGLQAEAYLQAGYVGGDFATPFIDGQARVDRSLASSEDFDLRAGAAAWGGAQDDGERLDVGPSASVSFRIGAARGRLAADYRFRVAGDAEPASGPALTLSAGF